MYKLFLFIFWLQIFLFWGCKTESKTTIAPKDIEVINLQVPQEENFLKSSDYFDSIKIVPLETTEKSLIASINRLVVSHDYIYILDRTSNSVLAFNNCGTFSFRIKSFGRGPAEYTQIGDFCVDFENERIVVYAHAPMKLLYYDLKGNFLAEDMLDDIYSNVMAVDGKIMLFDIDPIKKKYAWVKPYGSNSLKGSYEIPDFVLKFAYQRTGYPMVCKSNRPYFFSPLDYNIYLCTKDGIVPKYQLNFNENSIDINYLMSVNDNEISKLFQLCSEKEFGFFISNFRETDDYVIFRFEPGKTVIYSKKSSTAEVFRWHREDMAALGMGMYFAHDGDDNNILTIVEAQNLLTQFERIGWNLEPYRNDFPHFQKVENILDSISENSNPILVFFKFISN
ncbi:6-bladed beta-propeller [Alkalitalea saponilacus]|uniref:6-bladed beta-propeller protein n=1 Tax=Alkalitalea saponilacus TaxID=889453 RepID=A0A1T5GEY4_9BACT|nr:6-bladed beta-propeller [Alkalitalea saponilacus]ASB47949.1 hypothetical protein CDL62_01670 [Alkalitalea saponilacus]SKC06932.1 hypothetical protein SAMN03080601_01837 [Alkalitalea saponilacus]